MKRLISILVSMILVVGVLGGCSKKVNNEPTVGKDTTQTSITEAPKPTETTKPTEVAKEEPVITPTAIKVWHDNDQAMMDAIAETVNKALAADQITVTFEKKSGLTDQLKLYGNDEKNGPDLYLFAHDSLGTFAQMGILAPLTEVLSQDTLKDCIPMTLEAGVYQETQYLLPVYFETLLFMYNKALWKGEVPSTTEELYNYMVANTDTKNGTYAVVNQHSTAYNVAPFIYGFGGYIINEEANPGLSEQATMDAITYNEKFAKLEADGDYNTVTTLFNEGKAAAIIGGPWLMSGIKDAGIDLGIKALSEFKLPNGNGLAPFSGVQSIGVLKYAAASKKDALAKVLTAITSKEVAVRLASEFNCAPANSLAYDDAAVSSNAMVLAIKDTAVTAKPMPNIPEMGVMWGPTEALLAAVNKSGEEVTKAAEKYQKEALKAIADMK